MGKSTTAGIAGLAKEIGAEIEPGQDNPRVLGLYVHELVEQLLCALRNDDPPDPNTSALHVAAVFGTHLFHAASAGHAEAMRGFARDVGKLIDSIDYDDGWPVCPWLNALKGCTLAIDVTLDDPMRTRWPAHAGGEACELVLGYRGNFNAEIGERRKAWLRERLATAIRRAADAQTDLGRTLIQAQETGDAD